MWGFQVDAALGASCDYRARFSMECCDLDLSLAAGPDGRVDGKLRLWRLEAVEHIPAAAGTAAAMVTALEEVLAPFADINAERRRVPCTCSLHISSMVLPCLKWLLHYPSRPVIYRTVSKQELSVSYCTLPGCGT